jgi:hypothetical protein
MNDRDYRNRLHVWDLHRPDSLFHARRVIAAIGGAERARRFEPAGRYAVVVASEIEPIELGTSSIQDIASLEILLRDVVLNPDAQTRGEMFIQGLPDTVRMVQAVLAEDSRRRFRVTFQPQMDGTTLEDG